MTNLNKSLQFGNTASHQERKAPSSIGSSSEEKEDASVSLDKSDSNKSIHDYDDFPLVQSMMTSEARRTLALTREGAKQMEYPKSNVGWMKSLFVLEGRALDRIIIPWTIVTLNAVVWAIVYDTMTFRDPEGEDDVSASRTTLRKDYIEGTLELVLTTSMAFLLVFRLNRSATRFWMARGCWGIIVVRARSMVGSILLHGSHDPHHRDQTIKWIAAFSIASMNYTRGLFGENGGIDPNTVAGVLTQEELEGLNSSEHPPLYAADMIRFHLAGLFGPADFVTESNPEGIGSPHNTARAIAISDFRTQQLLSLENQLDVMIDEEGALERIKGTPLPLVYVTHLRTWLMLFLLTLPYFLDTSLGYAIIPVECLAAFALLGLEGAAAEVEAPFSKDRTNHLDMDSFCLAIYSNILQQAKEDARRRINTKQIKKA
jgi:putative membrane protein